MGERGPLSPTATACNDRNCWSDAPLWVRLADSWSVHACHLLWHSKCPFCAVCSVFWLLFSETTGKMQVFDYVIDDEGLNVSCHLCVLCPAVQHKYQHMKRHQTKQEELLPFILLLPLIPIILCLLVFSVLGLQHSLPGKGPLLSPGYVP